PHDLFDHDGRLHAGDVRPAGDLAGGQVDAGLVGGRVGTVVDDQEGGPGPGRVLAAYRGLGGRIGPYDREPRVGQLRFAGAHRRHRGGDLLGAEWVVRVLGQESPPDGSAGSATGAGRRAVTTSDQTTP